MIQNNKNMNNLFHNPDVTENGKIIKIFKFIQSLLQIKLLYKNISTTVHLQ